MRDRSRACDACYEVHDIDCSRPMFDVRRVIRELKIEMAASVSDHSDLRMSVS